MCELLLPLSARHGHHRNFLRATTYVVQALNAYKQPHIAMTFIRAAELWVESRERREKCDVSTAYIYMQALKAETQLLLNKVRTV